MSQLRPDRRPVRTHREVAPDESAPPLAPEVRPPDARPRKSQPVGGDALDGPVPLGWSEPDDRGVAPPSKRQQPLDDGEAPSVPPEGEPQRGRSAASVRASMRPRDPWRRPAPGTAGPAERRELSRGARVLTSGAVVAAVVGVLIVAAPIDFGGSESSPRRDALSVERERASRLEAALRREAGQRHAWEMWAREFDPRRYRKLKERAAARARKADNDTGG